jgi:hypothetical protein
MSEPVEAGFIIDLNDDLSDEVHQILTYMIGRGTSGIELSGLDHPLSHGSRKKAKEYKIVECRPREKVHGTTDGK